ncbi:Hsp70 family protein [Clostridium bornimense]|uniref:Hsp70 family protein n=1 Tax=Clostridium bornimense TaxID=1216932 RepID=UPI001C10E54C|nr:Hsp70 family protein [Clostridium bornimense]MBU5316536.1 Hsp70 family protein [Clostridium bornimense]
MGTIIGIDLGTTTSEIAYVKDGKPEVIINELGSRITPSVVGLTDENEIIIGNTAKGQAALKPDRTVMEVKRIMGTDKMVTLGDNVVTPEEVSAMILKELKRYAESYIGENITEAVITVPANFNDLQRQATKIAGELAGLKIERIINEPTAAAIAYSIDNLDKEEKIIVYDLGGGTFDITILNLLNGNLDIKTSRGNNKLGGKDFDERLTNYILKKFREDTNIDLSKNYIAMARIKEASERAKIDLSVMNFAEIEIPFIATDEKNNPLEINFKISREEFEGLIKDLIDITEVEVDKALEAAGYNKEDIDTVIAVGGSTRIPCVRELLKNKFGDKLKGGINVDEAVAMGAAIQGAIHKNDPKLSSIKIMDICMHTLGISVGKDTVDHIIMKDSKLPCTENKIYSTSFDNQKSMTIEVYQGDATLKSENTKIGEFKIEGIPEAPAGDEEVEVAFTYNIDGILEVTAEIISSGESIVGIIDTMGVNSKPIEYSEDLGKWSSSRLSSKSKTIIEMAEKKVPHLDSENKVKVVKVIESLKRAIIDDDDELVDKYDEELTDLLFEIC